MSNRRRLTGVAVGVFFLLATAFVCGQFWFLYFRPVSPLFHGQLFLACLLSLSFLLFKPKASGSDNVLWYDWVLALAALVPAAWAVHDFGAFVHRTALTLPIDIWMAVLLVFVLLEACRRTIGPVLPILAIGFLFYAMSGQIPFLNDLGTPSISLRRLAGTLYIMELGIFSQALQVAVRWIFIFLLFGTFLLMAGGDVFFSELGRQLNRSRKGGPAYVAISSSALFGMLSGSNMANVMTTGQFTIPLMRQAGYPPRTAAAIESVASTGGALTPPIMAAGALIMAEFTSRPYFDIIAAASIPAALFYLGLFIYVRGVTERLDIRVVDAPNGDASSAWRLMLRNWPILLSICWLVYRIANFYPVERAGLEAIVPLVLGILINNRAALHPRAIAERMTGFIASLIEVGSACAASGVLIGVILLTGIGIELSQFMVGLGQENLLLVLFLTMIVTIVLGMGVPGIAAYVIAAAVVVGPLTQLGVPAIAAHLFVFYFSLFAGLTPPVALTAFAAAGIAKSPPFSTGVKSMILALPAYLVAYAFALEPALLVVDSDPLQIAYQCVVCVAGVTLFAAGTSGYLSRPLNGPIRFITCALGVAFVYPAVLADAAALIGTILLGFYFAVAQRASRAPETMRAPKATE